MKKGQRHGLKVTTTRRRRYTGHVKRNPKILALSPPLQAAAGLMPNAARVDDMVSAAASASVLLAELGIGSPDDLREMEIGSGSWARAFAAPSGVVLKFTTDRDDAEAAEVIRRAGQIPGLPRIFDVRRLPSDVSEYVLSIGHGARGFVEQRSPIYAIVMEFVKPLSSDPAADEAFVTFQHLVVTRLSDLGEAVTDTASTVSRTVAKLLRQIYHGWAWLRRRGYEVLDLHGGNVGVASGGRLVIFDFGGGSRSPAAVDLEIPIASNPPLQRVKRIFSECFDRIEELFPDFGDAELHHDKRAGADNGAGSERQFAYCKDGDPMVIAFALKAEKLPEANLRGLMRHEFGHALEYRYGVRELQRRFGRLPEKVERRADVIAERVWGEPIVYDESLVQCVGVEGIPRRPRHLPDEKAKLRPNTSGGREWTSQRMFDELVSHYARGQIEDPRKLFGPSPRFVDARGEDWFWPSLVSTWEAGALRPDRWEVSLRRLAHTHHLSLPLRLLPYESNTLRGWKVMRVEGGELVSGADARLRFPMEKYACLKAGGNGIYLSTNRLYVIDHYSGHSPVEALLTLEFDRRKIVTGEGTLLDREPELSVSEAMIVDIELLKNEDLDDADEL